MTAREPPGISNKEANFVAPEKTPSHPSANSTAPPPMPDTFTVTFNKIAPSGLETGLLRSKHQTKPSLSSRRKKTHTRLFLFGLRFVLCALFVFTRLDGSYAQS